MPTHRASPPPLRERVPTKSLSPVDLAALVHAAARREFRGASVAITAVAVEIATATRLADRPMVVAVTAEALATTAIDIAITSGLADRVVISHLVPRTIAGRTGSAIVGVPATLHLVAGAGLGGARRAGPAAPHPLCVRQRHRAQQQHGSNCNIPCHPLSPLS